MEVALNQSHSNTGHSERGTAILEFGALLPLLILMCISVIEIGNAVNQYLQLARIGYEGARYGASLAGYEEGEYEESMVYQSLVQARVRRLLNDYGFAVGGAQIDTALIEPGEEADFRLVTVSVQVPVRPVYFNTYSWIRLRTESWAPYLFISSN